MENNEYYYFETIWLNNFPKEKKFINTKKVKNGNYNSLGVWGFLQEPKKPSEPQNIKGPTGIIKTEYWINQTWIDIKIFEKKVIALNVIGYNDIKFWYNTIYKQINREEKLNKLLK